MIIQIDFRYSVWDYISWDMFMLMLLGILFWCNCVFLIKQLFCCCFGDKRLSFGSFLLLFTANMWYYWNFMKIFGLVLVNWLLILPWKIIREWDERSIKEKLDKIEIIFCLKWNYIDLELHRKSSLTQACFQLAISTEYGMINTLERRSGSGQNPSWLFNVFREN